MKKEQKILGVIGGFTLIVMIVIGCMIVAITNNHNNIKKLQEANAQGNTILEEQTKEDENKVTGEDSVEQIDVNQYEQFAKAFFEPGSAPLVLDTDDISLYSDPECKIEIGKSKDFRFSSYQIAYLNINNKRVYAFMLEDGKTICYCRGDEMVILRH